VYWAEVPSSGGELNFQVGRGSLLLAESDVCPEKFSDCVWVVLGDVDALASKSGV
jgi:hypothetical protein